MLQIDPAEHAIPFTLLDRSQQCRAVFKSKAGSVCSRSPAAHLFGKDGKRGGVSRGSLQKSTPVIEALLGIRRANLSKLKLSEEVCFFHVVGTKRSTPAIIKAGVDSLCGLSSQNASQSKVRIRGVPALPP
jgi:hypothetical protein